MAKFQCNSSKTIIEVFATHDINGMRHNPSYTELAETVVQEEVPEVKPKKIVKKDPHSGMKLALEEE